MIYKTIQEESIQYEDSIEDYRKPIQYVSEDTLRKNLQDVIHADQNSKIDVRVSTPGNATFPATFVKYVMNEMNTKNIQAFHNIAFIQNRSLPFRFNNIEYYFGTNEDISNYSTIPYTMICEYPLARYSPSLYGKFYTLNPAKPISRIFFGCKSSAHQFCCGLECCNNVSIVDILRCSLFFLFLFILFVLGFNQISKCGRNESQENLLARLFNDMD